MFSFSYHVIIIYKHLFSSTSSLQWIEGVQIIFLPVGCVSFSICSYSFWDEPITKHNQRRILGVSRVPPAARRTPWPPKANLRVSLEIISSNIIVGVQGPGAPGVSAKDLKPWDLPEWKYWPPEMFWGKSP